MPLKNVSLRRRESLSKKEPHKFKITTVIEHNKPYLPIKKEVIKFKNLEHPLEKFKDPKSEKLIKKILENYECTKYIDPDQYYRQYHLPNFETSGVYSAVRKLTSINKGDFFKKKGVGYHIFLPLDGMSPGGYFYKGILEQIAPKARVTFLVTPSSENYDLKAIKNLKDNLLKTLNSQDKHFIVIDYFSASKNTLNKISTVLSQIYKTPIDVHDVFSPEFDHDLFISSGILHGAPIRTHNRNTVKDFDGKSSIPISEKYKQEVIKEGVFDDTHKLIYQRLKLDEKIKAYTYYYLGNEYVLDIMKSYKKLNME